MIPIELKLRNFLSYGEDVPPLDFTSFQLACLTGRNGHGKSALLDAITWAVWGEARKAGYSRTPDADLLRQNAEEMFAEFTFRLNERDYQVTREYHRKRRTGKLEFRVRENRDGDFIVLTGNNKRVTQKSIIQTLGLDYRTFVNSSFLQQGKADEFTRQPPKERKEILSTILGLDYYDRLLEEAKRRLSETRAERKVLEESLESIQIELEEEETVVEREKTLDSSLQEKEKILADIQKEIKTIQDKITGLERIHERIERGKEEEIRIKKRLGDHQTREEKLTKEIDESTALLAKEEEYQARYQRHEQIGKELHGLLAIDEQFQKLDGQRQVLEKSIEEQRSNIQVQLASLTSENGQIQKTKAECQEILDNQQAIERDYALFQKTLEEHKQLDEKKPAFDALQKQIQETETTIERERQSIAETIAELRGVTQTIPALKKEIEQTKQQLAQKSELEAGLETIKIELSNLIEQGQENNRLRERASSGLDQSKRSLDETLEKLDLLQSGKTQECPLCNSGLDRQKREDLLIRFQNDIATLQARIHDLTNQIKQRDTQREQMLTQHQEQEKKRAGAERELNRLQVLETSLKDRETELGNKQIQEQQIEKLTQTIERNDYAKEARLEQDRLKKEAGQTGYDPQRHSEITQQLNRQRAFELKWNQYQDILKRQKQWQKREMEILGEIDSLQTRLDEKDYARDEQKQLQNITAEIEPLKKTLQQRKPLQEEQHQLRNAPAEWNRVTAAKQRLPELEQDRKQIQQDREEYQKRVKQIGEERQKAAPALDELALHQQQLKQKETRRTETEKERNELQIQLGGARQKLEHLKKRKKEQKEKREKLTQTQRDESLYKTLTTAFSRNGIPAMIVDRALPELENDANNLLHRLTNGCCSVALESQRETRSGGISETLDIKISDEMGTRDYEMFSGGEAFRTDLALRIALSQLLCRRAGSKLQLLVIDEGFGTQDSEGLGHIIDAINEIQDEFEKILMVTHLEELKERFPVRIEITKELGAGSRFEVIHTL